MLEPKDFPVGVTLVCDGFPAWRGLVIEPGMFRCLVGASGTVKENGMTFPISEGYRPATYADMNRSPVEGERAVVVADGYEDDPAFGKIVTVERRSYDLWACRNPDGGPSRWLSESLAPLAAETQPECACEAVPSEQAFPNNCRECSHSIKAAVVGKDGSRYCSQECHDANQPAPAPRECERVAAVVAQLIRAYEALPAFEDDDPTNLLECEIILADAWRDRLPEFQPCGDCPACLARLSAEEERQIIEAEIDEQMTDGVVDMMLELQDIEQQDAAAKWRLDDNLRRVFG